MLNVPVIAYVGTVFCLKQSALLKCSD